MRQEAPGREKKLWNEELHNNFVLFITYYWHDQINGNKKGGAVVAEMRNAYKTLVGQYEGYS